MIDVGVEEVVFSDGFSVEREMESIDAHTRGERLFHSFAVIKSIRMLVSHQVCPVVARLF
jgi:hypothetical protein